MFDLLKFLYKYDDKCIIGILFWKNCFPLEHTVLPRYFHILIIKDRLEYKNRYPTWRIAEGGKGELLEQLPPCASLADSEQTHPSI